MCVVALTLINTASALTLLVLIAISSPSDFAAFNCPPAMLYARQKLAGNASLEGPVCGVLHIDGALPQSQASNAPCVLKLLNTLNAPGESFGQAFFSSFA
jgi:hypothetical protein